MAIRVYLYNKNYLMIQIKPGTTIQMLQHKIAEKLNIQKYKDFFCLFECRDDGCTMIFNI